MVSADALKHPVAVQKPVIEDRDTCLVIREILAIKVNDHR
jgi:hypothetical protein